MSPRPLLPALLALALSAPLFAAERGAVPKGERWLPASCEAPLAVARARGEETAGETAEALWNRRYRRGIAALGERDLGAAEVSFCQALEVARGFPREDLRFAETLDELGLTAYLAGDDDRAEAMQGAASAEILLALGPPADDLTEEERDHCRSSIQSYVTRLGWVLERQGKGELAAKLREAPHRVLARGYLPEEALLSRLDWLISRYLLIEDFRTADWLEGLRER